jgi:riboflavin kinase/FMN adenylyltransferase
MRIHLGLAAAHQTLARGIVAIGNFDGVHLGHRALFAEARARASQRGLGGPVCALTFEPHPARVLAPLLAPPLICSLARKRELLARLGVDALIEQPFDRAFAALSPEAFVELLAATGVAAVVVGADFTYGRARSGNVDSLRHALEERGVQLHIHPQVAVDGLVVSSTKVREFVLAGKVSAAAGLLGRPFDLDGEVVRGAGRGRTLGWPTANLKTAAQLLPGVGVYAVRARALEPGAARASASAIAPDGSGGGPQEIVYDAHEVDAPVIGGAANLGINPTFRAPGAQAGSASPLMLEVHLLDFSGDLYGRALRVEFIERLREEQRFPGPEALKAQIARDVEAARARLAAQID